MKALANASILKADGSKRRRSLDYFPSSKLPYRDLCGLLVLLIATSGCGGGGGGTLTETAAPPSIFLAKDNPSFGSATLPSNILEFPTSANGAVSPSASITGPANAVFSGLAVDGTGNAYVGGEIFGTGGGSGGPPLVAVEILIYAPGASGKNPTRTITSSSLHVKLRSHQRARCG
jgi:hypothetical protein